MLYGIVLQRLKGRNELLATWEMALHVKAKPGGPGAAPEQSPADSDVPPAA
jgi:hypothetical protein